MKASCSTNIDYYCLLSFARKKEKNVAELLVSVLDDWKNLPEELQPILDTPAPADDGWNIGVAPYFAGVSIFLLAGCCY
jgi:hypothetical protein